MKLVFDDKAAGSIGERAFYGSSIVGPLTVPKDVTQIGAESCNFVKKILTFLKKSKK